MDWNSNSYRNNFVYDLETESGTFGTYSTICAKNTDSIFASYPIPPDCEHTEEKIEHAIKCAKAVEEEVSKIHSISNGNRATFLFNHKGSDFGEDARVIINTAAGVYEMYVNDTGANTS